MADILYSVWLSTVLAPGSESFAKLKTSFSTPEEIYHATEGKLTEVLGERSKGTVAELMKKDLNRARAILDFRSLGKVPFGIVTYDDPAYPERLRAIKNPPPVLYVLGTMPDLSNAFTVSCVGCREYTAYGAKMTFEIAHDLARGGATVISGMAYGADSVALSAAISAGGSVVAVIGSGIDVIYPTEHEKLAKKIAENGAVITEFPPGTLPFGTNFPKRNRIISALGDVTLVTCGSIRSGSLITAELAKGQGKEIYALPGNVNDPLCEATAHLLRSGAHAATCAEDILFAYEKQYPACINVARLLGSAPPPMEEVLKDAHVAFKNAKKEKKQRRRTEETIVPEEVLSTTPSVASDEAEKIRRAGIIESLDPICREIYDRIPETGDCAVDEIVPDGVPVQRVIGIVTVLEMKHLVRQTAGGRVARF